MRPLARWACVSSKAWKCVLNPKLCTLNRLFKGVERRPNLENLNPKLFFQRPGKASLSAGACNANKGE